MTKMNTFWQDRIKIKLLFSTLYLLISLVIRSRHFDVYTFLINTITPSHKLVWLQIFPFLLCFLILLLIAITTKIILVLNTKTTNISEVCFYVRLLFATLRLTLFTLNISHLIQNSLLISHLMSVQPIIPYPKFQIIDKYISFYKPLEKIWTSMPELRRGCSVCSKPLTISVEFKIYLKMKYFGVRQTIIQFLRNCGAATPYNSVTSILSSFSDSSR
jgi:hypothetical protein